MDHHILKGMILGLAAFAVFSTSDMLLKYEASHYPLFECIFFNTLTGIIALILLSFRHGGPKRALASRAAKLQMIRALCLGGEFLLVVYAFTKLPLATVYTLVLSAPILTVFLGPLLFAEDRFDKRTLPAVLIGFMGVIVALHPGAMPAGWAAIGALASAFFFALSNCLIRRMPADEPALTFAFYPSLITGLMTAAWMIWVRPAMPPFIDLTLMACSGLCTVAALTLLARAITDAPAAMIMPFQYTQLIWGAVFGFFIFGDGLDGFTLAGAALIFASGLWLIWCGRRERTIINPESP